VKYWFEIEDARRWGLPAAAVLAHLKYWIERNTSAGEEPCMTQGIKEMAEYLPFLTPSKIQRALAKLEQVGAIYRKPNGFDRRHTYCLGTIPDHAWNESEPSMMQNRTIDDANVDRVHIETNTLKRTRENTREDLEYQRPTEQEVIQYMEDRGAHELAATLGPSFWNYYEANGWMVNGTPIAKWKPKANQWINTERNKQSNERRKGFNPAGFTPDGLKDFIDNG
jgi:hypothetical protein